jgi:hypothetical protein
MNAPSPSVVGIALVVPSEPVEEPLLLLELLLAEPPPVAPSSAAPLEDDEQAASTHTLVANLTNATLEPTIRA